MMILKKRHLIAGCLCVAVAAGGCQGQTPGGNAAGSAATTATAEVSGRLEGGLRIVTIDPSAPAPVVRVYRGDYVQPALTTGEPFTVTVDSLALSWTWPVPAGDKPYLKMTEPGRFPFRLGELTGTFEVIEYQAVALREVGAKEAAQIIADLKPFVLDVRTPGEFADGHLQGATLLPIQEMQGRIGELSSHQQEPVFVYCHSGNRSTVAAKLLIDAGFKQVINLRRGIVDWKAAGLPLEK